MVKSSWRARWVKSPLVGPVEAGRRKLPRSVDGEAWSWFSIATVASARPWHREPARTGRGRWRRSANALLAVAVVAVALVATVVEARPGWPPADVDRRFRFTALPLAEPAGMTPERIRTVHPSLQRIDAWISSVGAGVAVGDLDGDGLSNDLCHVDPRFDKVIVSPAPSTGPRYPVMTLDPPAEFLDPVTMAPMGCVLGDLNADGALDAVVYYWGRTPLLFVNRGGAPRPDSFVLKEPVPSGERWFSNALTLADVDGDGLLDMVVGNYFQDGARILDPNDGERQTMQDSMSDSFNGGHSRVLRQRPRAITTAVTATEALAFEEVVLDDRQGKGWTLAIGAADLDGDLLPELYFARDFGPDRLLHNRSKPGRISLELIHGERGFSVPSSKVLGYDSFKGMGVDFADLNGDERLDFMVSNITTDFGLHESNFLFLSGPSGRLGDYSDHSRRLGVAQAGWTWDVRFGDFDNDAHSEIVQATGFLKGNTNRWPELHELASGNDVVLKDPRAWPRLGLDDDLSGHQPNRFFVRARDGRYVNAAKAADLDARAVARGIATADIDGDGDLDMVVANQWEPSMLYLNQCLSCGRSLVLNLRHGPTGASATSKGPGSPALGATATLTLPGGRRLLGHVDGGSGHSGKRSAEVHFGLGELGPEVPLGVELTWRGPDGTAHARTVELVAGRHDLLLDPTGEVHVMVRNGGAS